MISTKNSHEQELFDEFTIVACAPYSYTHVYVLLQMEEQDLEEEYPFFHLLVYRIHDKNWTLVEALGEGPNFEDMVFTPDGYLMLMGELGEVVRYKHQDGELELPKIVDENMPVESMYVKLSTVGSDTYAAGITRTIMQYQSDAKWQQIGQDTHTADMKKKHNLQMGFLCIDGFDSNDIYASGYASDTWHFNGDTWRRIDFPTSNVTLQTVLCTPNGDVYFGGDLGCLMRGRDDDWQVAESEFFNKHKKINNLTWFNDCIYFASTGTELFCLDQQHNIQPVYEIAPLASYTAGMLRASEHMLVVCGVRTVRIYDGADWRVVASF